MNRGPAIFASSIAVISLLCVTVVAGEALKVGYPKK
jgi:hypothetical protein